MNDLQIEYFLAVADNLSFTKTAAEKIVSQPAVSKQIAALEKELDVTLFKRSHKLLKLTESGKVYADHFRKYQKDLAFVQEIVSAIQTNTNLPLRVGCGDGWTLSEFLPGIIQKLQMHSPAVNISLECFPFEQHYSALVENDIDVAITPRTNIPALSTLSVFHLTYLPSIIVYSEHCKVAKIDNPKPTDFQNELFLVPMRENDTLARSMVNGHLESYCFLPKILAVNSVDSMIAGISNGLGVAVVDKWTMMHNFRSVPLKSQHDIAVAWRSNTGNPALKFFLKELAAIFYPNGNCSFLNVLD